jgi:putative transposon-encoded protein
MREISLKNKEFTLKDNVLALLEREIKPFGTSAKADVPKKYLGKKAYVLILDD